jgi:hypothetical protein
MKLFEIISVGFNVTYQLLIRFSAFVRYWRNNTTTLLNIPLIISDADVQIYGKDPAGKPEGY